MRRDPPGVGLTVRQRKTLWAVCDHERRHGRMPTVRELADALGVNISAAYAALRRLEERGWIATEPGVIRGIAVLRKPPPRALVMVREDSGDAVLREIGVTV